MVVKSGLLFNFPGKKCRLQIFCKFLSLTKIHYFVFDGCNNLSCKTYHINIFELLVHVLLCYR